LIFILSINFFDITRTDGNKSYYITKIDLSLSSHINKHNKKIENVIAKFDISLNILISSNFYLFLIDEFASILTWIKII